MVSTIAWASVCASSIPGIVVGMVEGQSGAGARKGGLPNSFTLKSVAVGNRVRGSGQGRWVAYRSCQSA